MNDNELQSVAELAQNVRQHFDQIEQDVPEQSFLVGGAVRDVLMGLEPNDFDFVVVGETPESMLEHGFKPIDASSFPVFHDSKNEEWALARTEQKDGEGYTGFEVFTDDVTLPEDLKRRDLTINSMALDMNNIMKSGDNVESMLIDPNGGAEDIENGVLRHVSEAFEEDPLRILRCSRYAGRFPEFEVADDTMSLMGRLVPELNRMSRSRIGDEIEKALAQAREPSRIFEVLRDCGALAVLLPELDRGDTIQAGPERHHAEGSVLDHTLMSLDRMDRLCKENGIDGRDRVRRLFAVLGHDIGKVIVHDG